MITILGGGVAGAALAGALGRLGRRDVVVFDPLPVGSGSTGRALGGFRTQQGSRMNVELSLASRPWFEGRASRIAFSPVGYLYLALDEPQALELRERAEWQRSVGLPIQHPEPGALVPSMEVGDVLGTNYCALDGVYLPRLILDCMVEEARALGADFRYGSEASAADLEAGAVVICAGIWSSRVAEQLGVRLQVSPVERGIFQLGPFDWLPPTIPVTLEIGTGFHFRERDGRLLTIGPGDQHDFSSHREWLSRRLPAAAVERPENHWTGFYEMTFDNHPLVGATSRPGVWASCGFSGHGVMHAPAIAECLAAMIVGASPPLDIAALDPLRTEGLVDRTQL